MTTQLCEATGDKLADVHHYAQDLATSEDPSEVEVGRNLLLILKCKNR
ncbi:hypothetical protein AAHB33_11755 [Paenarthrobacter sp. S56]